MVVLKRVLVLAMALFSSAACGTKGDALPKVDVEQAMRQVLTQAQAVAEIAGVELVPASATSIRPCTGQGGETPDSVYAFNGGFWLYPSKEQLVPIVERASELWTANGWNMHPLERFEDGSARVYGTDPNTDIDYYLDTLPDFGGLTLEITGPCYEMPEGDAPYGPYTFKPGVLPPAVSPGPSAT